MMLKKYLRMIVALFLCCSIVLNNNLLTFADTKSSSIKEKIKDVGNDAGDAISSGVKKATDTAKEVGKKATDTAKEVGKKATDTAKEVGKKATDTAKDIGEGTVELANKTGNAIKDTFKRINPQFFKNGWEYMSKIGGSTLGAIAGQSYINSVQSAIDITRQSIVDRVSTQQPIYSKAGFVAEEWIAGTFNVDAAVRGSKERAYTVKSNGLGSVDIGTTYGETASSKYYNDAKGSAKAQATSWMQEYKKYCDTQSKAGKAIPTAEEYLNEHSNGKSLSEIYDSIYGDQSRIIPSDQLEDAKNYLLQKSSKDLVSDDDIRKAVGKTNADTMKKLKDRLRAPDGTSSKPLTKGEAQAIAELCESGEFNPEDFGLRVSDLITPQYILKQSVGAGVSSAALRAALSIGPQIYSIVSEAINSGEIDANELKKMGVDGVLSGTEGFIEGSVSCAILTACKAGKLGAGLVSASPDVIGALTVLVIDSVKYGYQLSQGKITAVEYADKLTGEIFSSAVSIGAVALLVHFLPAVPIVYLAGSMAGGLLGTAGYKFGKEVVLEVVGENGFETIVPKNVSKDKSIGQTTVAKMNIKEELTDFGDMLLTTTKEGLISLKPAS